MDGTLARLALVVALVVVVSALGWWWQRRSRRVRVDEQGHFSAEELHRVGLDATGASTLAVLLGSPACAPCTAVKRVLREVAEQRNGLVWVDVDAGDHLEIAERHHVLRVPTLFVLDGSGRILARTSGVPAARELTAIVDAGVPAGIPQ